MNKNLGVLLSAFWVGVLGAVPLAALFVFYTMPLFAEKILHYKQEGTAIAVQSVFEILTTFEDKVVRKEMSRAEAQGQALALIKNLRYNKSEYFWINDVHPKMVMHPFKPELDGKDLTDFKDPNGKKLFVEMSQVAQATEEGGYVAYEWGKPGYKTPVPKISYVKLFKPWGWIVGNGVYLDDINAVTAELEQTNYRYFGLGLLFLIATSLFSAFRQLTRWVHPIQASLSQLRDEATTLSELRLAVSRTSEDLALSTTDQKNAVTEMAAAATEIGEMANSSAETAKLSSESASHASTAVAEGIEAMRQIAVALSEIKQVGDRSMASFQSLTGQLEAIQNIMNQVSAKTELINDIVFQTKLLSFNASVEAARSGDAGKGFAVVADEIANLAKSSGQSARDIERILGESRTLVAKVAEQAHAESAAVAAATEQTTARGFTLIENGQNLFSMIADRTSQADQFSQSILVAVNEQNRGIQEILRGLTVIDEKTQNNVAVAAQAKNQSAMISDTSGELDEVVRRLQMATGGPAGLQKSAA